MPLAKISKRWTPAINSVMSTDEWVLFWFLVLFFVLGLAWRLLGV